MGVVDPAPPPLPVVDVVTLQTFAPVSHNLARAQIQGISITSSRPFVRPKPHQMPPAHRRLVSKAIKSYLQAGLIRRTTKSPYTSYLFPVPKDTRTYRIVFNLKQLSKSLSRTNLYLPLVYQVAQRHASTYKYFGKINWENAFYHFPVHDSSQKYLTLRHQGKHHAFTRMPFGLGTAPVLMSALVTSFAQQLRQHFQFTWAHMDDFIIADNSKRPFQLLPHILRLWESAGIQINRAKSLLQPHRKLEALGAVWSNSGLSITASRQTSVLQALEALPTTRPGSSRHKQLMGLLTCVTPFLPGTPYALTTALGRACNRSFLPFAVLARIYALIQAFSSNCVICKLKLTQRTPSPGAAGRAKAYYSCSYQNACVSRDTI